MVAIPQVSVSPYPKERVSERDCVVGRLTLLHRRQNGTHEQLRISAEIAAYTMIRIALQSNSLATGR